MAGPSNPALAYDTGHLQEGDVISSDISSVVLDQTLLITAGSRESRTINASPGRGPGRAIICGWFAVEIGGPQVVDLVPVRNPEIDHPYVLWCWYADTLESLPGHPRVSVYTDSGVPGEPEDEDDISRFALESIEFMAPNQVMNPGRSHVVGIETWLAVDSQLEYAEVHASAGPVWVSVRPIFRDLVWDLGNGDLLTCTGSKDATTIWNPDHTEQSSSCTYAYADISSDAVALGGSHDVTATITWDIERRSFQQLQWLPWTTASSTTTQTIQVTELQAVIN